MYKLTVIAGPNTGTSFPLKDGETSVGRQTGNVIVLPSAKVSKKHCVFSVGFDEITLSDAGSSNGTFVNGSLTKSRKLKLGDRVSIGDFVLEVSRPVMRAAGDAPFSGMPGLVTQNPGGMISHGGIPGAIAPPGGSGVPTLGGPAAGGSEMPVPTDIAGKIHWAFERTFMPFFYGLNLKYDWKVICTVIFGLFVMFSMVISIYPLLQSNQETIIKETKLRAQFMARQIVERNMVALAEGAESKADIGSIAREEGVVVAVLTDLDSRILAPASNAGNHLAAGDVGIVARRAAQYFQKGRETGYATALDQNMVVAIEPVKVLDPRVGRNVTVGMGIVSLDTSLAMPDIGTVGVTYSHSFILTGLLGLLMLIVLYRLTLKRFEVLNEDLDKVLKGDMGSVTNEFKSEDLDQLWDVINSALKRLPKGGGDEGVSGVGTTPSDDYVTVVRMIGDLNIFGLLVCDEERKIVYSNTIFEDMAGFRASDAAGQEVGAAARDQAFISMSSDMFNQVETGGTASEEFEFSGVVVTIHAAAFGTAGAPKGFVMVVMKQEGGD